MLLGVTLPGADLLPSKSHSQKLKERKTLSAKTADGSCSSPPAVLLAATALGSTNVHTAVADSPPEKTPWWKLQPQESPPPPFWLSGPEASDPPKGMLKEHHWREGVLASGQLCWATTPPKYPQELFVGMERRGEEGTPASSLGTSPLKPRLPGEGLCNCCHHPGCS